MKDAVFWDVAPCRSCVNERFGRTYRLHLQGRKIREPGTSVSRYVHPKCRFTQDLHGTTSQKTAIFIKPVRLRNVKRDYFPLPQGQNNGSCFIQSSSLLQLTSGLTRTIDLCLDISQEATSPLTGSTYFPIQTSLGAICLVNHEIQFCNS
jgi:hypothetical protein